MALNLSALMRYANGTIPNHTPAHDNAGKFPEYRDQLDVAFKHYSLGLASGAAEPLGTPDDADIRLLEIFPHPTGSGRIRGSLHHYCIYVPSRRIPYSAVSYVWGTQEEDRLIVIDGKGFLVTENLQTILWRLRQPDRSVYVWIDAICIYQRMTQEKAKQVDMMDEIFSTADEVMIYLGEDTDNSHLVVGFAGKIVENLMALPESQATVTIKEQDLVKFGLPPVTDLGWKALKDCFKRPWFERKWILQEYTLAKLALCILGDSCFNFELLTLTHRLCRQHGLDQISVGWNSNLTIPQEHPLTVIDLIRTLVRHNFDEDQKAETPKLPWLLGATSYAKVSKHPHDHIYALLGLHALSGDLLMFPYPSIDYDRSVEDVFIDYACIPEWKMPDAGTSLLELASQSKVLNLPSWVPDWSRTTSLEYVLHSSTPDTAGASVGKDRSSFTFDHSGKKLSVQGAFIDHITEATQVIYDENVSGVWAEEYAEMKQLGFGFLTKLTRQRCCATAKGNRLLAHHLAQVGDQIFIVYGERVPLVIRRSGVHYRFVGCAFLSSVMQGKGLAPNSPHYVGSSIQDLTLV